MSLTNGQNHETMAKTTKTPPTNRGVQSTGLPVGGIILDWLQATFPNLPEIRKNLRSTFEPESERDKGMYGYDKSATVLTFGTLLWSSTRPELGIHLILPSQALAQWNGDAWLLLSIVVNNQGVVKRIDFAMDDTTGLVNLDTIAFKLENGEIVTRFRHWRKWLDQAEIGSGQPDFTGVTMGSRTSESYVRIYDKAAERIKKGLPVDVDNWIRVELETKGDRADALTKKVLECKGGEERARLVRTILFGLVDFKEPSPTDGNKSRWVTCEWWLLFLDEVEKSTLSLPRPSQTIDTVKEWFKHAVAPMACVILLHQTDENEESGYDWLMAVIAEGERRFRLKHERIMRSGIDKGANKE